MSPGIPRRKYTPIISTCYKILLKFVKVYLKKRRFTIYKEGGTAMRFRDKKQHEKRAVKTLVVNRDRFGNVSVQVGGRVEVGVSERRVNVLFKRNKKQRGVR